MVTLTWNVQVQEKNLYLSEFHSEFEFEFF